MEQLNLILKFGKKKKQMKILRKTSKVCFDVNYEVSAYSWNYEPIAQIFLNNRQTATKLKKNLM